MVVTGVLSSWLVIERKLSFCRSSCFCSVISCTSDTIVFTFPSLSFSTELNHSHHIILPSFVAFLCCILFLSTLPLINCSSILFTHSKLPACAWQPSFS